MTPSVKLKPYITQVRGIAYKPDEIADTPFENSVPLLKANNITDDGLDSSSLIYIAADKIKSEQFIRAGDLLLAASSGSKKAIGKNAHFPESFSGSFGAFCKVVRPKNGLHSDYLKHFFKTRYYRSSIEKAVQGANINNLRNEHLDDLEISLPPLNDQIRIAHLLGKVEGLIVQRKQHLQHLDDLLKSVFLEMFGDPARNEKGWPINPLVIYMSEQPNNGLYKPQSSYGSGMKIIRIDSFYDGIVQNIEELKRVEVTDAELLKFEIRPFDVLVNRVNSIEYLGKIGVVPAIAEPMVYESNMMRFRLNHEAMLPVFLMYFWRTPYLKSQINSKAKKAVNQASVNQQDVTGLLVPQPPIDLQKQFSTIVEKVETLKSRYQQSLADLEALYGALSQRAFRGELDLSRVPMSL
ncbi:restriction endonuclease subunit S [Nitrosomonas sp. H1_AOB3]|uniref:restriction endonuclease subunit S n=1 Tax=Nitrosomonas sp. H1_AOB3 TaxID=2741553 RepID=UPI00193536AC|nr:restriction endonuclease subunit S [Nitrosomonas sp. H1_AOB3]QOJ09955.1 MAG: restriction endonuclease subunit S [Nitrosomonas sp. H1_AOB3]